MRTISHAPSVIMSFQCQRDSYAQNYTSHVISCQQANTAGELNGYEVVLQDTILFPEGGGQPYDQGKLGGCDVMKVIRRGPHAVHFVIPSGKEEAWPLQPGTEVEMSVDWSRRFDHMQQHSGQHLITAITDQLYGYKTTSWNLAVGSENKCYIELATAKMREEQVRIVEDKCNTSIRERIPMTPRWLAPDSPELDKVRSRGLPDDFAGNEVRVVEITGIDANMCCGTHVSNLSDIQCIKLLYTESKKGSTILYYIAGNRVTEYLTHSLRVERTLNKLLSVGQEEHCPAVERLVKSGKQMTKTARSQLREIAMLTAANHRLTHSDQQLACYHRDDGDVEYMNTLTNELASGPCKCVLVTVGGDRGSGHFILAGDENMVAQLGPKVAAIMEGKGGGRKGRYQGKVNKLEAREEAKAMLQDTLTTH